MSVDWGTITYTVTQDIVKTLYFNTKCTFFTWSNISIKLSHGKEIYSKLVSPSNFKLYTYGFSFISTHFTS